MAPGRSDSAVPCAPLAALCSQACHLSEAKPLKTSLPLLIACLAATPLPACAENYLKAPDRIDWQAGGLYDGMFSDGTHFQINLPYRAPSRVPARERDILPAAYWYPMHYNGTTTIPLEARHVDGRIKLAWRRGSRKTVDESFSVTLSADGASGTGEWSSASRRKRLTFKLVRGPTYRAVVVDRPQRKQKPAFSFSALFPEVGNAGADAWIRERAGNCPADRRCANTVSLGWWSSYDTMALLVSNQGSSHGSSRVTNNLETRHYRMDPTGMYHVGFDSFVKPAAECRATVSRAIVDELRRQKVAGAERGALVEGKEPRFVPSVNGITFTYGPGELGPGAQAYTSVYVPLYRHDLCMSFPIPMIPNCAEPEPQPEPKSEQEYVWLCEVKSTPEAAA